MNQNARRIKTGWTILALLSATITAYSQLAASAWPKARGGGQNLGRAASGAATTGTLLWEYKFMKRVREERTDPNGNKYYVYVDKPADPTTSVAVGADGTVFLADDGMQVSALDYKTGTRKWKKVMPAVVYSTPAIGADGTVYLGCDDSKLYALDGASGNTKWSYATAGPIRSSPSIGSDGTVYIGSDDGSLHAIGASGVRKWVFPTGSPVKSSPAVTPEGRIVFGSSNGKLYVLEASGAKRHEYTTGGAVLAAPAVGSDGTIFVASMDRKVYALKEFQPKGGSPSLLKSWEFLAPEGFDACLAVGPNGSVFAGCRNGILYGISPTGTQMWTIEMDNGHGQADRGPVIGFDGVVYANCNVGVRALDPLTGVDRWTNRVYSAGSSPALASNGNIYVPRGAYLVALH